MTPSTTASAHLVVGDRARTMLPRVLNRVSAERVLVVASPRAAECAGLRTLLHGFQVRWFAGFAPNPTLSQALRGSRLRERTQPDAIVAVGGGSAIDTAKLLRTLPGDQDAAVRVLNGLEPPAPDNRLPLVAVPTTAGSGSEVTRFATVYVNGVKASLDHPTVLPQWALVDPQLSATCLRPLAYACAFDALCHAIESYWSRRATVDSRALALKALEGIVCVLGRRTWPFDDDDRRTLAQAATTAGQAIDVTRTTAAHAFSYHLTAQYAVPHGVACLLNMLWLFEYNEGPDTAALSRALDGLDGGDTTDRLCSLLWRAGYSDRLGDYGVSPGDIPMLLDSGFASGRAENNPVALDRHLIAQRLSTLM